MSTPQSTPASMRNRADYARRIEACWGAARARVIDAGQVLIEAKAALKHGEFKAMVEQDLPFGYQTANRLMSIARNPELTKVEHAKLLPSDWTALYELSRLPSERLKEAMSDGRVSAETNRADARRLRAEPQRAERLARQERQAATTVTMGDIARAGRRYGLLYIDFPWNHTARSDKGLEKAPGRHYRTMTLDELKGEPVAALAADDCVAYVWVASTHLDQAQELMVHYGFAYKSRHTWLKTEDEPEQLADGRIAYKPALGTGYWNRDVDELLLIFTKGSPAAPIPGSQENSAIPAKVGAHSEKPRKFREMIERLFPHPNDGGLTKLEMYARVTAEQCLKIGGTGEPGYWRGEDGWHYWGDGVLPPATVDGEPVDTETGEILARAEVSEAAPTPSTETAGAAPDSDVPAGPGAVPDATLGPDAAGGGCGSPDPASTDDVFDIPAHLRRPKPAEASL